MIQVYRICFLRVISKHMALMFEIHCHKSLVNPLQFTFSLTRVCIICRQLSKLSSDSFIYIQKNILRYNSFILVLILDLMTSDLALYQINMSHKMNSTLCFLPVCFYFSACPLLVDWESPLCSDWLSWGMYLPERLPAF